MCAKFSNRVGKAFSLVGWNLVDGLSTLSSRGSCNLLCDAFYSSVPPETRPRDGYCGVGTLVFDKIRLSQEEQIDASHERKSASSVQQVVQAGSCYRVQRSLYFEAHKNLPRQARASGPLTGFQAQHTRRLDSMSFRCELARQ